MAWVVDTCLLLDIGLDDTTFVQKSEDLLDANRADGLVICPVTYVEMAPAFSGNYEVLEDFLIGLGVSYDEEWTNADTRLASAMWGDYVGKRRFRLVPKRPIADVLIGAFTGRFSGLLTRNPTDFSSLRPAITVITPS